MLLPHDHQIPDEQADDSGLRKRMRAIAEVRRRFGYQRLHVLLKREGNLVSHKKLFRLYRERFRPAQRSVLTRPRPKIDIGVRANLAGRTD